MRAFSDVCELTQPLGWAGVFLGVDFWGFSGGETGEDSEDADEDEEVVDEVGDVDECEAWLGADAICANSVLSEKLDAGLA